MASPLFLTGEELAQLTGWKLKSKQVKWLRENGIPFRISATGHPVVTRAVVEGREPPEPLASDKPRPWTPRVIGAA